MNPENRGTLPRPLDDNDVALFVSLPPQNPPRTPEELENRKPEKIAAAEKRLTEVFNIRARDSPSVVVGDRLPKVPYKRTVEALVFEWGEDEDDDFIDDQRNQKAPSRPVEACARYRDRLAVDCPP